MDKKLKLVNIVQVMFIRQILPCQQREFNLWEFNPAQHRTLNRLFDTTHEDAWRVLFKSAEVPPPITEDHGFSANELPWPFWSSPAPYKGPESASS